MSHFYDGKDLEEELSRVSCPDDDFSFEDLFEYEPPGSDLPAGDQGLSAAVWSPQLTPPCLWAVRCLLWRVACRLVLNERVDQKVGQLLKSVVV